MARNEKDGTSLQDTHTKWQLVITQHQFPNNHPYISSCKLQLAEISTPATYIGMVIWEWCRVITGTLYVYFVDQCHPYIFL